jgi:diadenosine tetraphosphate (Ap4A) HIT family hydrolase
MECFLCKKHTGEFAHPPGGYIYEDSLWKVCHAPVDRGPLGTLIVESTRHFLDFAEMLPDEASSYAILLQKLYTELRALTGAERIYHVVLLEGVSHFHAWLLPRTKEIPERGIAFLQTDFTCEESSAQILAMALREALK